MTREDPVIHITPTDGKQAFFRYETDAQGVTETVYLRQVDGEVSEVNRLRYDSKGQLLMNRHSLDPRIRIPPNAEHSDQEPAGWSGSPI